MSFWEPAQPSVLNVLTTVSMTPGFTFGTLGPSSGVTCIHPTHPGPKDWDPRRGICGCMTPDEYRDKICKV